METRLNTIKTDLYKVFIEGTANSLQIARVFVLVAVPVVSVFLAAVH